MKQISQSVYYNGVLNPGMRVFDVVMRTEYGTSYNSYTVKGGDKTAVIEASHLHFADSYGEELEAALGGVTPDYLVLNHTEPDHTGCVAALVARYPALTLVASPAAAIYLKNITNIPDLNVMVVKDGDSIDLGGRTLRFISAPFLHWPDSMFTWLEEERILFSCDFLGCHFCEPNLLDIKISYPEQYWAAVKYYYDCIFEPFSGYVRAGLAKIEELDIEMVCNSHGPILTKAGHLGAVIERYRAWSELRSAAARRIPIFYCTAYGNTELLAGAVREGLLRVLPDAEVVLYNVIEHDISALAAELNASSAFLLGALTINRDAVPPLWQLLSHIDAVNISGRPAALFGSFGWSGEAFRNLAERLTSVKCRVFDEQFKVNFVPTGDDLARAADFGQRFAQSIFG